MGIDYYSCVNCSEGFPDVIDYAYCGGCGRCWCSDDCAEADGFECPVDEDGDYIDDESSCSYCRGEQFDDSEVLEQTLNLLGKTRADIIAILKAKKGADVIDGN